MGDFRSIFAGGDTAGLAVKLDQATDLPLSCEETSMFGSRETLGSNVPNLRDRGFGTGLIKFAAHLAH